jgi:hypothetical protein
MKYIIDEIELKDLIKSLLDIPDENDIEDIKKDFLSDKKPVECIASGEVSHRTGKGTVYGDFGSYPSEVLVISVGNKTTNEIQDIIDDIPKGKNIEIYIKEV